MGKKRWIRVAWISGGILAVLAVGMLLVYRPWIQRPAQANEETMRLFWETQGGLVRSQEAQVMSYLLPEGEPVVGNVEEVRRLFGFMVRDGAIGTQTYLDLNRYLDEHLPAAETGSP
jgi:hypothetical protein